ncbi:MAG TPA: hypothetical protein V6D17_15310, partial [Candidatus Obscuribacterales bacterium]
AAAATTAAAAAGMMLKAGQMLGPMLIACLMATSTLASIQSVAEGPPKPTREQMLSAKKDELLKKEAVHGKLPELERDLASVFWQEGDLVSAEKILSNLWQSGMTNWKSAKPIEFRQDAWLLASVYADHGHFDSSYSAFETVLAQDKHLKGDKSEPVAADLNNMAVCLYLQSTTLKDPVQRAAALRKALDYLRASSRLWGELKKASTQVNIERNNQLQRLITRDLSQT